MEQVIFQKINKVEGHGILAVLYGAGYTCGVPCHIGGSEIPVWVRQVSHLRSLPHRLLRRKRD